ncbi:putative general amino acid permease agp2 protein [Phaeoacremonium minimum UCRPA7]|uniref:Putative general amino acid permease agp2 protein n=1 Tax=Phaeoacremonium minimum (strain UCR-PA7) TaxID=1286976 RepID=R8BMQ2_PHAM7|nr:putative general amino acid permease agp2 protein [Phaeoacremonium minimum UCRPA7]EOO00612.1 putative general amino acid permease agp2 protein [Phaeoacremonium minimum UCRPA7]
MSSEIHHHSSAGSGTVDEKKASYDQDDLREGLVEVSGNADSLKRHLGNRQIQLIAIGGTVGTGLFVSIGSGLMNGGPASLFIAYTFYSCLVGLVNNCMAEMAIYMPVSGSFIRFAGKWVDEAFGFMSGWNFFLYEATLIPFEISALNLVLTFWRDDIPVAAVCAACIVLYGAINVFAVKYYGEAEFWLSSGKFLLILIVYSFTFVTMVGGNPQHDAYGFRYWNNPGAFAEYITTGALGRFQGFLAALWSAAFTIVGPEYLAMVAGEAQRPRLYLKKGFKTVYWRFGFFFIGGALCVGVILPYNDPTMTENAGAGTAAASPYVIAMQNMGVDVLPHITNALLVTSIFSAGNAYTYCAMRSLYGLALEGQAPKFLRKCTKSGIPIYCYCATMFFPLLSFLCVSNGSAQAVTWLANLTEASQLIDYMIMSTTYIFFFRAMKAQGLDRRTLPYRGWWQPYCAWVSLVLMTMILGCYGYATFLPGWWDIGDFFSYYTMVFVAILSYAGWKVIKKTKVVSPLEADLVWDKPIIDAYEDSLKTKPEGFWNEVLQMFRLKKKKNEPVEAI